MSEHDSGPVLEDLPYDELRERAFSIAEAKHDHAFFRDLRRHLPGTTAMAAEGGSLGDIAGSIIDLVHASREMTGQETVGDLEPLFRARFATYIRENEPA